MKTRTVMLSDKLYAKLHNLATDQDISMEELITHLLVNYLNQEGSEHEQPMSLEGPSFSHEVVASIKAELSHKK